MHHLSTVFQRLTGVKIDNAEDLEVVIPLYILFTKQDRGQTLTQNKVL